MCVGRCGEERGDGVGGGEAARRWPLMEADRGGWSVVHGRGDVRGPRGERNIFADFVAGPIYFWLRTHNLLARAGIHFNRFTECPPGFFVNT